MSVYILHCERHGTQKSFVSVGPGKSIQSGDWTALSLQMMIEFHLRELCGWLASEKQKHTLRLNYVCTHNSKLILQTASLQFRLRMTQNTPD